nr:immunoglobulin heavy chain junction region [Macaca mulatta]MOV47482.1 immunoglobulin heavy chain junction region [Macaca mulatta]MOV47579.1 immunoglobulin heavy chain junction region [Macaca mulatta]MOV47629.1 immunoglobulin heavy chain junction region [Macaca mulatta]MOV47677.1 immunoglobulin heavy chain junction region [Macaca mulatta]
CARVQSNFDSW